MITKRCAKVIHIMSSKRISVILPTYNGELYLEQTLESIASQTLAIYQLVCSDDQSTDKTVEIIESFANKVNFDVVCLRHNPNGVTSNYINALAAADGDIILITDQDDVWVDKKAEKMSQALSDETVSLVSHDSLLVDDSLNTLNLTLRRDLDSSKKLCKLINCVSIESNLEAYFRGGIPLLAHTLGFRSELVPLLLTKPTDIGEWWFEEWVSFVALTRGKLFLLEQHLILYRQHETQTSGGLIHNKTSNLNITSGENKYESRIRKMDYCVNLIKDNRGDIRRLTAFSKYLNFLQIRQTSIMQDSFINSTQRIISQLIKGEYHRYAQGLRSAVLDLLTNLKSR